MKATSVFNFLTAVMFLLTAQITWGAPAEITKGQCEAQCESQKEDPAILEKCTEKSKDKDGKDNPLARLQCIDSAASSCKVKCADLESTKDVKLACTDAVKEWKEAAGKSAGACDDYEAVKGENSCEARIKACEKKISEVANLYNSQGTTGNGLNASGGSIDVLMQFYAQKNGIDPKTISGGGSSSGTSCLKWSNDKADEKKKEIDNKIERIDDKIKTVKQKIVDLEKEIAKENESLRKEAATLDEEKEKIQTTYKENIAKLDVKKREKYTSLNKTMQDNLVKVRNLTNAIAQVKDKMEREKFEQTQRLVDFAEDKIDSQCKSAVDTARGCFTRAAKGEKFGDKDPCNGFSATGKGITGTGIMVKRLNDVRNACFERAQMAQDKLRYDYQTKVKQYDQDMIEKQNQIKDLNKNAELEKQEFDAITKENETEKTNETQSSDQKQANLADKLAKLQTSTQEKIAASAKQMEQLKLEAEELAARKMPSKLGIIPDSNGNDISVAHREAKKAIEATEISRSTAYEKCGCNDNPDPKIKATCTKLKTSSSDSTSGGVKRTGRYGR